MVEPVKSRDQLERIKQKKDIKTDSELARRIGTHKQQITKIKDNGFPRYVSGLVDLLLED